MNWGAGLLVLVLLAGCSNDDGSSSPQSEDTASPVDPECLRAVEAARPIGVLNDFGDIATACSSIEQFELAAEQTGAVAEGLEPITLLRGACAQDDQQAACGGDLSEGPEGGPPGGPTCARLSLLIEVLQDGSELAGAEVDGELADLEDSVRSGLDSTFLPLPSDIADPALVLVGSRDDPEAFAAAADEMYATCVASGYTPREF